MTLLTDQAKIDEIKKHFWNKRWRLTSWVFYKIKNKAWQIVPFIPNEFQLYYLKNKHNRNLILKARQHWFSTMIQIDFLDDALFNKNLSVGIIAQDKQTAQLIRKDKIEVALENLPDFCKDYWKFDKSNAHEISLSNWSSIYVSNSFRWGTLQRLHISEYGKICAKYPDKAREIRTWAVEAVEMNQQIVIESTAEWNEWDFYEKAEQYNKIIWQPLTPLDYRFFFFPWRVNKDYSYDALVVTIPKETDAYFQKLEDEYWVYLSEWQKKRYYLKQKDLKDEMKREYPSVYNEAFEVATEWAYLQSQINIMYQQNRVTRVPYDPNLLVYTWRDIGWAWWWDDMVVWFAQIFSNEIRIIDYREWTWYSMLYVLKNVVDTKPYKYAKHIGPHDMRVHSQMTWETRLEVAKKAWYEFELVESPAWAVSNRIDIMRTLFSKVRLDAKNAIAWLNKLKNYKRKRNDSTWSRTSEVHKNGAQHASDAFWYLLQYFSENFYSVDKTVKEESVMSMNHINIKDFT